MRKRLFGRAITFLSMFLSADDAKELFDELREIAIKHKENG
jgi:hypothetical protein|tara:strand:+ start:354 stop:476 length:123 start_codon:yes stop_codon:yes gene_type:complete